MIPSTTLYLALVLAAGQQALAANDWSVPCIQGQCSWDIPADSGASGTVHIWGPTTAISDITPAAGWSILSCDPVATTQSIRLVCGGDNPDCGHLFQGGAANTIVRLPESCGPMPFARVAQHSVVQNNSSSSGRRRFDSPGVVSEVKIDADFAAIPPLQGNSSVQFALQGMNAQGSPNLVAPVRRGGHWPARSVYGSRHGIHRRNFITDGLNSLKNANTFNKTIAQSTTPVNFSGTTNLFHTNIQCPSNTVPQISASASVSLDAGADVNASVTLGAVAAGTFVPPSITQLGLYFGLDGTIDANLSIAANVTGKVSSGNIPLFQIGIPGLTFPGILDIGPQFKITGEIDAQLALTNIEASVDLKYDLNGISFVFPPQDSSQAGTTTPGSNQGVTFSGNPDVGATFTATGHLIPQLEVGLSALGGVASTSVFVNLDAAVDFGVATSTANDAQACASANTTLGVNIGAQGSFFNVFDATVQKSLFNASFPLLENKCFGGSDSNATSTSNATAGSRRRDARWAQALHRDIPRGGSVLPLRSRDVSLVCPLSPSRAKVSLNQRIA